MRKEDRLMDLLGQLDDSFLVDLDDEVSTALKEKRKKLWERRFGFKELLLQRRLC